MKRLTADLYDGIQFMLGDELSRTVPPDDVELFFPGSSAAFAETKDCVAELKFQWDDASYLPKDAALELALRPTREEIALVASTFTLPSDYEVDFAKENGRAPNEEEKQEARHLAAKIELTKDRPLFGLPTRFLDPLKAGVMKVVVFGTSRQGDGQKHRLYVDVDHLLKIRSSTQVNFYRRGTRVDIVRTATVGNDAYFVAFCIMPSWDKDGAVPGLIMAFPEDILDPVACLRVALIAKAVPHWRSVIKSVAAIMSCADPEAAGGVEPQEGDKEDDEDVG